MYFIVVYQLPLNFCIVTGWLNKRCLSQGMFLYQVMMTLYFLNYVINEPESTLNKYVIIASLKNEPMGILINRIPGLRLLISSIPVSKTCLVNLISKDTHLVLSFLGLGLHLVCGL